MARRSQAHTVSPATNDVIGELGDTTIGPPDVYKSLPGASSVSELNPSVSSEDTTADPPVPRRSHPAELSQLGPQFTLPPQAVATSGSDALSSAFVVPDMDMARAQLIVKHTISAIGSSPSPAAAPATSSTTPSTRLRNQSLWPRRRHRI